ncbi:MAG: hypothetical protein AAF604_15645 [Acidobacteriota bacterium]
MHSNRIEINGQPVSASAVGTNDGLNFGRFDHGEISVHPYQAWISGQSVLSALEASYARLLRELQEDDPFEPSKLSEIGYPVLEEVLRSYPGHLSEVIDHLGRELLSTVFPFGAQSRYVINSLDGYEVEAKGLRIRGRCFEYSRGHRKVPG